MQITMIGTGYVGLVTGTCFAEVGHHVICVDTNESKIQNLREGVSPIYEPGLDDMMQRNSRHERLSFTTSLSGALRGSQMAFIAVGTPEGEDGSADLSHVKSVAHSIGRLLEGDLTVVVKSTVPVGTGDLVEDIISTELSRRGKTYHVTVASNPEFLKEGTAIQDFMKPDRIVVGLNQSAAATAFRELYQPFITDDLGKLLIMDRRSAEITKYGANAMLATRISFMNELAILCEKLGANIDNVRQGIGSDARIGRKFLYAGPGYGGSCFPKDVSALLRTSESAGVTLRVLDAVTRANDYQKTHVFGKVLNYFGSMQGKTVAIWGLTFKPGTDDVREAPSKTLIELLLQHGATVKAHDPIGRDNFAKNFGSKPSLTYHETAYQSIQAADAVVLMTEWSEYKRPNWAKVAGLMRNKAIFDFRNQYATEELRHHGFYYACVGRPDSQRENQEA